MTVTDLDIIQKIKNTVCIVCGQRFSLPRAGKLYCSPNCKQFSFYHKEEIAKLIGPTSGISDIPLQLHLKEYEHYCKLVSLWKEFRELEGKKSSRYSTFFEEDEVRYRKLEKGLPKYLKALILRHLSVEEWSYFKVLYSHLNLEHFLKLLSAIDREFIERLRGNEHYTAGKNDVLKKHFETHLLKIAMGKIIFV